MESNPVGPPCRWSRYEYRHFHRYHGITAKRAGERYERYQRFFLSKGFLYRNILAYGLDNPFSTADAKRVMISEFLRYGENGFRRRRGIEKG